MCPRSRAPTGVAFRHQEGSRFAVIIAEPRQLSADVVDEAFHCCCLVRSSPNVLVSAMAARPGIGSVLHAAVGPAKITVSRMDAAGLDSQRSLQIHKGLIILARKISAKYWRARRDSNS
jgi:hypothetical protein